MKNTVEIVYGTAETQSRITLQVAAGATVLEAIQQSGLLCDWPDLTLSQSKIGIFGKFVSPETLIHDQDRIEIYRPLTIDPKQARKLRIKK